MQTDIKIIDTATPFFKRVAREFPGEFRRALKSTGWWLREEIKAGIKSGAPGGLSYKGYPDVTTSRVLDAMRGRGRTKTGRWQRARRLSGHKPMGRLYQATRYKYYADSNRVVIGWISKSAEKIGTLQEQGGRIPITGKMRRFFWAAGVPLSKTKTHIDIPARPTIAPEYRENAPKAPRYIEDKIWGYLRKAEKQ